MEISPIIGIRSAPALSSKETFLGLPGIFEIEYSSRTGDETYSPGDGKPASGYEDDEDKEDAYEHLEDDEEPAPGVLATHHGQAGSVSYFA